MCSQHTQYLNVTVLRKNMLIGKFDFFPLQFTNELFVDAFKSECAKFSEFSDSQYSCQSGYTIFLVARIMADDYMRRIQHLSIRNENGALVVQFACGTLLINARQIPSIWQ